MTDDALEELVRQGERLIDKQVDWLPEGDDKAEHFLFVASLDLSGVIPLIVFAFRQGPNAADRRFWVSLAAATAFLVGPFVEFLRAYTGVRRAPGLGVGWDPSRLREAAAEGDDLDDVHRSTLRGIEAWYRDLERQQSRDALHRRRGVVLLLLSGSSISGAFLYLGWVVL